MKKRKQKARPKLNCKLRDKIIARIFMGNYLFIKNTGVRVSVENFGDDIGEYAVNRNGRDYCKITFETTPTTKALKLVNNYNIYKNTQSNTVSTNASIDLHNLSLSPFETEAAKLLYDKSK